MTLPRVAILGGGVGAVTAAVELSAPGWEKRFSAITIYQQGWRLGGKGACGRGPDGRIEEHGLHIWFGFYENAFRLMDQCHDELDALQTAGKPRWQLAFDNVDDSFERCSQLALADHDGCGWKLWTADFFDEVDDRPWAEPDPRNPGERPEDWSVVFYASRCLHLAADLAHSLVRSDPGLAMVAAPAKDAYAGATTLDQAADALWSSLTGDVQQALASAAEALDLLVAEADHPLALDIADMALRAIDLAADFLRGRLDDLVREEDSVRRAFYVVDLMIAIARGLIEDGVIEAGSFDVVDDIDFREWLLGHGASQETAGCALVRGIVYDLGFAYVDGEPQRPSCAAGTALRGLLRAFFTYRGSLMWKMRSGMGDVIFAPLYELLVKRGVKVQFFHRVEAVRAKGGAIEEIEIDVQANVAPTAGPESFLPPANATPTKAKTWPSGPEGVIVSSAAKKGAVKSPEAEVYESWWADRNETKVATKVLKRGAPDGFDEVVFGLPVTCVPYVASDLMKASPRWKAAVDHLRTVPTQAMQLWLDCDASSLADVESGIVVSGYCEPYDTWADMTQLVSQEGVPGSATVAYFCNVLADSKPPPRGQADAWLAEQKALVKAQALRFLRRDVRALWPLATDPFTGVFNWQRLVAPQSASGESRLDHQYLRANVEPSERYVLSVPGSGAHRIAPDATGFSNLYAVGDWTACKIDAGCVEAAVISGKLAANGLHAQYGHLSQINDIIGLDGP